MNSRPAVRHRGPEDYVLNLGQMRDSALLASFRAPAETLDQETSVLHGATREIDSRRQKDSAASKNKGTLVLRGRGRTTRRPGARRGGAAATADTTAGPSSARGSTGRLGRMSHIVDAEV